jgi:hypothetical protein
MPLPPKAVLWEKNITINLAEGETENIVSEVPASVFKDVTGKQKLSTTFYSNTMQIINISDPFAITQQTPLQTHPLIWKEQWTA